jgi:hypothetical protein
MENLKKIEVIEKTEQPSQEKSERRFRFKPRFAFNKDLFKKKKFWGLVGGLIFLFLIRLFIKKV